MPTRLQRRTRTEPSLDPVDMLGELFASPAGANALVDNGLSLAVHMRQAGALAEQAGAPDHLVAAALLHDVGHVLHALLAGDFSPSCRIGIAHEQAGAVWLAHWFAEAVTEPVRLHVAAKRYLCAVDADYLDQLSPAARWSLILQGGPMIVDEARAFERLPYSVAAVAVRRWDDAAQDPAAPTPPFAHFELRLRRLLRARLSR